MIAAHDIPTFYEFFAGGGMARLGLGQHWRCRFANDICPKKAASYRAAFGDRELRVCDVAALTTRDLPGSPDLVWASFPCQDLSLAGAGAGLGGERSGAFRPFWRLIRGLIADARAPRLIVLENVTGALTSHGGKDFEFLISALAKAGYRAGALIIDAVRFLPQSRPRLFIVGADARIDATAQAQPTHPWHTPAIRAAHERLPAALRDQWVWWGMPAPLAAPLTLDAILEPDCSAQWNPAEQTAHILKLMSPLHREKVAAAQATGRRIAGTVYRRTRHGLQRAEVRFDQIAGCLRTPAGGSSRQTVVVVEGESIRMRLLSAREAARLMGVPDFYPLPARYNEAYHLFGDGVAAPVAAWLSERLLLPLLRPASTPAVETKYFAIMHDRSHAGIDPGART